MTKYKFSYVDLPDSLKLNSDDFELADVGRARKTLQATQKLNSRLRHGDELPENEADLDEIKTNSAPASTKSEAKARLRRTQRILSRKVPR